jgi:hypothetical protein
MKRHDECIAAGCQRNAAAHKHRHTWERIQGVCIFARVVGFEKVRATEMRVVCIAMS